MIIQNILFAQEEICNEQELYFRKVSSDTISLETYFNAFSIGKWRKYTRLEDLTLVLHTSADVDVKAMSAIGTVANPTTENTFFKARSGNSLAEAGVTVERHEIEVDIETEALADGTVKNSIHFEKLPGDGIIYVELTGREGDVPTICTGYYECGDVEPNEVDLALGICTYKREEYVRRNLGVLRAAIIENADSVLNGHVDVYVSDNGNTLEPLEEEHIHIYPNKNAGGASGFTRAMIESILNHPEGTYSHIVLMDDDIVLSANVLERTYQFLQLLKDEYKETMIGAEMFELDKRYVQFEAGAECTGMTSRFFHKMWDMREADAISANEEATPVNYSGWWYNVVPASFVREDNLPLPMFVHYDDIEYGMRNAFSGNETILLNGICVWHPQGIGKANVQMKYYDVRNVLIAMAGTKYECTAKQIKRNLFKRTVAGILRYRYNDVDAVIAAVNDYLDGPTPFIEKDPEEKHQELRCFNYKQISLRDAGLENEKIHCDRPKNGKARLLASALCWLVPGQNNVRVADLYDMGMPFRSRKLFHVDSSTGQGIMVEKSYHEAFRVYGAYRQLSKRIAREMSSANHAWDVKRETLTSRTFWEEYLGIGGEKH